MATDESAGNNPGNKPSNRPGYNPGNSSIDNTDPPSVRRRYIQDVDKDKSMFDQLHRLRRISEVCENDINENQEISFWDCVIAAAGGLFVFILVAMLSYGMIHLFNKYF